MLFANVTVAQPDTLLITDYTKVLFTYDLKDGLEPVTEIEAEKQLSFFFRGQDKGFLKIKNNFPFHVWLDDRLFNKYSNEALIESDLLVNQINDTVLVTLGSDRFQELDCAFIQLGNSKKVTDFLPILRGKDTNSGDFRIISTLIILLLFALFLKNTGSRVKSFFSGLIKLKRNIDETNVEVFNLNGLLFILLVTLTFSAFIVSDYSLRNDFWGYSLSWATIIFYSLIVLITKRMAASLFGRLLRTDFIKNQQFFDFLIGVFIFSLPVLLFVNANYLFGWFSVEELNDRAFNLIPYGLLLFNAWILIKFINNSGGEKLPIIAYLCVTEIIPAVILISWFFK
jgi:hypothetical protein